MAAEQEKGVNIFYPEGRQEWREWLELNHEKEQSVWVVQYRKDAGMPTLTWSEAVDEALCFGWIDSTRKTWGENRFIQFFCKRKPKSAWSRVNKEKIARLTAEGKMKPAGQASVETARLNGSWNMLDEVEELIIPEDLQQAFDLNPGSETFFLGLSKSARKILLHWIVTAKRPETRSRRISEVAAHAARNEKPSQFR